MAKYYRASFPAIGIELPFGYQKISNLSTIQMSDKIQQFLFPIIIDGKIKVKIIVGSPDPHGPFKARARDGHYSAYLTFFFGQFLNLPEDFLIKLDVDVKVEKEENNNLIVIGDPGTNLITQEINQFLPINFNIIHYDARAHKMNYI